MIGQVPAVPLVILLLCAGTGEEATRVLSADSSVVHDARVDALVRLAAFAREREPVLGDAVDLAIEAPTIVWMFSSGHGRTMTLGRIEPSAEGAVDRRLSLSPTTESPRSTFPFDDAWNVGFCERTLSGSDFERIVATIATILDSSSRPKAEPPPDPSGRHTVRYYSTSNDFGCWVLLTGAGRVREAAFHGYVSSLNEERLLAPRAAIDALRAFDGVPSRTLDVDDEARAQFDALFPLLSAAWSESWWFEQERACVLGGRVGSRAMIRWSLEWVGRDPSRSGHGARMPYRAATALATITAADLRFDEAGAPRPLREVARDYRELLED